MLSLIFGVIFVNINLINARDGDSWCDIASCRRLGSHIACNNTGEFYKRCVNPVQILLSPKQISDILYHHNTARNVVAGSFFGFPPASRMSRLSWDPTMAKFAELNTKQCDMRHDVCRNTERFPYAGQNLAVFMTTSSYTIDVVIAKTMKIWFNEHTKTPRSTIERFDGRNVHEIGHFTQIVKDDALVVGCAISVYQNGNWNNYLMACNYGTTNILNRPIYTSGMPTSECVTERDGIYQNLCS